MLAKREVSIYGIRLYEHQRVKRFRHSYDRVPETPPRATLGWSYSGLQNINCGHGNEAGAIQVSGFFTLLYFEVLVE